MSRKPSDTFTRFTPTSPHASRPAPTSSSFNSSSPSSPRITTPDPNETPAQRVARLRAQHRSQRDNLKLSAVDRLIYRGRIWADITHRIAAYTLIGFTGVAGCVAIYGLTSLITHNRRQKRAWIEREMNRLHDAQAAFLKGEATPEQLHLLEQERAGDEIAARALAEKERKKQEGILGRAKAFIGSGSTIEPVREVVQPRKEIPVRQGGERVFEEEWIESDVRPKATSSRLQTEQVVASGIQGVGLDSKGRPVPMDRAVKEYESQQFSQNPPRKTSEDTLRTDTGFRGGSLDILANNISVAVVGERNSGWFSWLGGSKS